MEFLEIHFIVLVVASECVHQSVTLLKPLVPTLNLLPFKKRMSEDATLDFLGLSNKYAKPAEEYEVVTKDGYILTVFHIPGRLPPIFIQHGVLDTADTFIIRGNGSLAVTLARAGHDLWFGNVRGTRYSRKHLFLNPNYDRKYWNYSMHEIGYYDLPAMIDFVLDKTGQSELTAIGHSQGNAIFYVMGSSRPEYNNKIKLLIAMAPIAFLHNVQPPMSVVIKLAPLLNDILLKLDQEELFNNYSSLKYILGIICPQLPLEYDLCARGLLLFAGSDPEESEVDKEFINVLFGHYPTGVSRKNALHLSQIARSRRFQQFDHGKEKNLELYGRETPPKYDLSKVSMRVELFTGRSDKISTVEDVNILNRKLPNSVHRILKRKQMNHLDFTWGKHMNKYLFPLIFQVLEKYSRN